MLKYFDQAKYLGIELMLLDAAFNTLNGSEISSVSRYD
jgi:hypothetical protein